MSEKKQTENDERERQIVSAINWKPCDCRLRIEQKLLTHYADEFGPGNTTGVELKGFAFSVGERGVEYIAVMPFEVTYRHTTKRSGKVQLKTKKGSFHFNYCPFCGQPATQEAATRLTKAVDGSISVSAVPNG